MTGDYNCESTDPLSSSVDSDRRSIIFNLFDDDYVVVPKIDSFTHVHKWGSTSNLGHVFHTSPVTIADVVVSDSSFTSDHFSLFYGAQIGVLVILLTRLLKMICILY